MNRSLWISAFVAVVMLSNPIVDLPLSHTPTLVLVMGGLAVLASWLHSHGRKTIPVPSPGQALRPAEAK